MKEPDLAALDLWDFEKTRAMAEEIREFVRTRQDLADESGYWLKIADELIETADCVELVIAASAAIHNWRRSAAS
jgi:predicted transcriptional regulator